MPELPKWPSGEHIKVSFVARRQSTDSYPECCMRQSNQFYFVSFFSFMLNSSSSLQRITLVYTFAGFCLIDCVVRQKKVGPPGDCHGRTLQVVRHLETSERGQIAPDRKGFGRSGLSHNCGCQLPSIGKVIWPTIGLEKPSPAKS